MASEPRRNAELTVEVAPTCEGRWRACLRGEGSRLGRPDLLVTYGSSAAEALSRLGDSIDPETAGDVLAANLTDQDLIEAERAEWAERARERDGREKEAAHV